jgi:hypothetical protein
MECYELHQFLAVVGADERREQRARPTKQCTPNQKVDMHVFGIGLSHPFLFLIPVFLSEQRKNPMFWS